MTSQLSSEIYGGHDHDHERISSGWGGPWEEKVVHVVGVGEEEDGEEA